MSKTFNSRIRVANLKKNVFLLEKNLHSRVSPSVSPPMKITMACNVYIAAATISYATI